MNFLALQIGYAVIGIGLLISVIWLMSRSPLLRWLIKLTALAFWGLFTVGGVLFVVLEIYLPQGRYGEAIASIVASAVVCVPWFIFGLPELKKCLVDKHERKFVVWE
jgi:hypothetical protein